MFKLPSLIIALLLTFYALAQKSPHGDKLSIKCNVCHNSDSWTMKTKNNTFDHSQTNYPLIGQHKAPECKKCHKDLLFSNAKTTCVSCHKDIHQQTVGQDCERCHTPRAWGVQNITEIHKQSRFPLQGQHAQIDCYQCHKSASLLRFDPMGLECSECHTKNYIATTEPSHLASKFPKDCFLCHNEKNWQPAKFDHNTNTEFPLNGGHFGVDCINCHPKGYTETSKDCVSCHQNNYNSTKNPGHTAAKFSTDCKTCHTSTAWIPATYNHNISTTFPLIGGHIGVSCNSCHSKGFTGIAKECESCHLTNFNSTTSPSHIVAKFITDCKICHTPASWRPATFDHNTSTTFPLTGGHKGIGCIDCHSKGYAGTSSVCVNCHQNNYNSATNPGHIAAKFSTDCKTCHTSTAWKPAIYNHNTSTTFPLTGGHIGVACINCHSKGYAGISKECENCHLTNFNATTSPSHIVAKYTTDCKICHTSTAWKPATFSHNTSTTFPLTGGHIGVSCISCHSKGYAGISTVCESCHQNNYIATTNPGHIAAKISTDCKTCHTSTGWKPANYNHTINTTFPLIGSHIGVDCIRCHTKGYAGTLKECESCHLADFNATTSPSHIAAKYTTDCKICHSETGWKPANFNHTANTTFPLTGGHAWVACISCHAKGYTGTSSICVSCHQNNYNATTNPGHVAAKFSTDCKSCHTVASWRPSTYNHSTSTTFPLTGGHIGVTCISCHSKGYSGTSTACVSCHQSNYNASTSPGHVAAKFSTDCKTCHTVTAWKPSTFNHNTGTTFPITGGHIGVSCISCHSKGYSGTSATCVSCHQNNYNASTNPGHVAAKFSTDCKTCHTVTAWKPSTFNHNTGTTFPITGGHIGVSCISCHSKGYTGTSTTCVSCHQNNYNATTNPGHIAAKFSTDCKTCHSVTAWKPATFNHNTSTTFIISGGHVGVACISCHSKGYSGTSKECVSCHQNNYNATTNPGHIAAKFSTDCKICHAVTAWKPAIFNHNTSTTFALTGGHIGVDCISCHSKGYTGTSKECVSCHLNNYNTTTNPGHVAAKFSTDCKTCHTVTAWKPATFNHNTSTTFPLTGGHINVSCINCHSKGYTGTSTVCVSCHQNDYNASTNPGHVAAKFSTDCKLCHNSTAWKPSTFNHTTGTTFPLKGSHNSVACINCHSKGYAGIATTCVSCHLAKYTATTNPAHATAKFPTNCELCHAETVWTSSTYNHDIQYFRIYSGKHKGRWTLCTACHTNATNYAVFSCVTACHAKSSTDSEHKGKTGYVYNSTNCLSCHPKI